MKNAALHWVRLPLQGVENCRELGGYAVVTGEQTAWHTYIRSSDLSRLTDEDKQFLAAYGVRHVIDLRSADEITKAPNPLADAAFCTYANIPVIGSDVSNLVFSAKDFTMGKMYVELLQTSDGIGQVLQAIAAAEGGVLFHCAAGKDRTGIVAMLLLMLAGVAKQDIISNYEVTHTNIVSLRESFKSYGVMNEELILSKAESIEQAYNFIVETYGTVEAYVATKGVTAEQIADIRTRFIV